MHRAAKQSLLTLPADGLYLQQKFAPPTSKPPEYANGCPSHSSCLRVVTHQPRQVKALGMYLDVSSQESAKSAVRFLLHQLPNIRSLEVRHTETISLMVALC